MKYVLFYYLLFFVFKIYYIIVFKIYYSDLKNYIGRLYYNLQVVYLPILVYILYWFIIVKGML